MSTKHVVEIAKKYGGDINTIWPYNIMFTITSSKFQYMESTWLGSNTPGYPGFGYKIIMNREGERYETYAMIHDINVSFTGKIDNGEKLPCIIRGDGGGGIVLGSFWYPVGFTGGLYGYLGPASEAVKLITGVDVAFEGDIENYTRTISIYNNTGDLPALEGPIIPPDVKYIALDVEKGGSYYARYDNNTGEFTAL